MTKTIVNVLVIVSACVFVTWTATPAAAQADDAFKALPAGQIDQAQKNKAAHVASTTLTNQFKGKFEPLSDDFTQQMKEALPPEKQKEVINSIRGKLGEFQSMEFVEAVASQAMPGIIVYRFKGKFSNSPESPEIRVALDRQGKVAGLWIVPWKDKLS
jgi:hypothetical protein